jgi:amidase
VRCGTSSTGLPIGVQIAAAPWREDIVLGVARRLEEIFGGWRAAPKELMDLRVSDTLRFISR